MMNADCHRCLRCYCYGCCFRWTSPTMAAISTNSPCDWWRCDCAYCPHTSDHISRRHSKSNCYYYYCYYCYCYWWLFYWHWTTFLVAGNDHASSNDHRHCTVSILSLTVLPADCDHRCHRRQNSLYPAHCWWLSCDQRLAMAWHIFLLHCLLRSSPLTVTFVKWHFCCCACRLTVHSRYDRHYCSPNHCYRFCCLWPALCSHWSPPLSLSCSQLHWTASN